jgi:8-oxo-dGTP pyrophosphatase MutT (NUDIX family)
MRQSVRELVAGITPSDEVEAEHQADVLTWIDSGVEIFRRVKPTTPPKHLVSYCMLVDSDNGRALLVDHRDAQRWLPAGGHIEPDEHPVAAAQREIHEELRIRPPFHRGVGGLPLFVTVTSTGGLSESHTDVSLWFVFEGSMGEAVAADEQELIAARWWLFDEIRSVGGARFDPHLPRFVKKFRRQVA